MAQLRLSAGTASVSHCCRIIVVIAAAVAELPHSNSTPWSAKHVLRSCLRFHMAGFCFNTTNTIAPWGNVASAPSSLLLQRQRRWFYLPASEAGKWSLALAFPARETESERERERESSDIVTNLIKLSKVQSKRRVSNLPRPLQQPLTLHCCLIFIWGFAAFSLSD